MIQVGIRVKRINQAILSAIYFELHNTIFVWIVFSNFPLYLIKICCGLVYFQITIDELGESI